MEAVSDHGGPVAWELAKLKRIGPRKPWGFWRLGTSSHGGIWVWEFGMSRRR